MKIVLLLIVLCISIIYCAPIPFCDSDCLVGLINQVPTALTAGSPSSVVIELASFRDEMIASEPVDAQFTGDHLDYWQTSELYSFDAEPVDAYFTGDDLDLLQTSELFFSKAKPFDTYLTDDDLDLNYRSDLYFSAIAADLSEGYYSDSDIISTVNYWQNSYQALTATDMPENPDSLSMSNEETLLVHTPTPTASNILPTTITFTQMGFAAHTAFTLSRTSLLTATSTNDKSSPLAQATPAATLVRKTEYFKPTALVTRIPALTDTIKVLQSSTSPDTRKISGFTILPYDTISNLKNSLYNILKNLYNRLILLINSTSDNTAKLTNDDLLLSSKGVPPTFMSRPKAEVPALFLDSTFTSLKDRLYKILNSAYDKTQNRTTTTSVPENNDNSILFYELSTSFMRYITDINYETPAYHQLFDIASTMMDETASSTIDMDPTITTPTEAEEAEPSITQGSDYDAFMQTEDDVTASIAVVDTLEHLSEFHEAKVYDPSPTHKNYDDYDDYDHFDAYDDDGWKNPELEAYYDKQPSGLTKVQTGILASCGVLAVAGIAIGIFVWRHRVHDITRSIPNKKKAHDLRLCFDDTVVVINMEEECGRSPKVTVPERARTMKREVDLEAGFISPLDLPPTEFVPFVGESNIELVSRAQVMHDLERRRVHDEILYSQYHN